MINSCHPFANLPALIYFTWFQKNNIFSGVIRILFQAYIGKLDYYSIFPHSNPMVQGFSIARTLVQQI